MPHLLPASSISDRTPNGGSGMSVQTLKLGPLEVRHHAQQEGRKRNLPSRICIKKIKLFKAKLSCENPKTRKLGFGPWKCN